MKIYVNTQNEIISIDVIPNIVDFEMFEVDMTRKDLFGNYCDAVIKGHKYEPTYEFLFKEDGNHERDPETGAVMYKLDENGEKIFTGYACYPFIDYNMLMLIQAQYESQQEELFKIQAQTIYMAMMIDVDLEVMG